MSGKTINFQALPSEAPNTLPDKGIYVYEILSAEMKRSNAGNEYMEIKASLSKGDGKKKGQIFDRIMDIDSDVPRFKLRQFITAMNLPITGDFTLSDVSKMVKGKKCLVDITHEKSKDPQYPDKAIVDPFSAEVYYPIGRAAELLGIQSPGGAAPINAPDAADSGDTSY